MADGTIVFGANCTWWDGIENAVPGPSGLPSCPHCGSVLFETEASRWWADVQRWEAKGHPGYRTVIEWQRGKCFRTHSEARRAFRAFEAAKVAP